MNLTAARTHGGPPLNPVTNQWNWQYIMHNHILQQLVGVHIIQRGFHNYTCNRFKQKIYKKIHVRILFIQQQGLVKLEYERKWTCKLIQEMGTINKKAESGWTSTTNTITLTTSAHHSWLVNSQMLRIFFSSIIDCCLN